MKYVVITAKHHDGFALFDSAVNDFDRIDSTTFKRDIIRELSDACHRNGLKFGVFIPRPRTGTSRTLRSCRPAASGAT